jgi:hypothetical protein
LTSGYPQAGVPAYTDPVSRPVPTLTTLAPNTAVAATAGSTVVTVTGTNYTNATHLSFGGVIDHYRVTAINYISPTQLKATFNLVGIVPSSVAVIAVNQDGQVSTPSVPFTLT